MPRVLLTTFPGEQHGMGLLMVEALLVPEGAQCISLGVQTPIEDIRRAAVAHDAHVVALSFSGAFPVRQAGRASRRCAGSCRRRIAVWAGGEMTRRVRKALPGVLLAPDIAATTVALEGLAGTVGLDGTGSRARSCALSAGVRASKFARASTPTASVGGRQHKKVSGHGDDPAQIIDLWLESVTKMVSKRRCSGRFLPIRLAAQQP